MPYDRPTLQEIIDRNKSDIKSRTERSETFLQKSVYNVLATVFGGSEHLMYDFIEYTKEQLFVSTADEESLEKHGAEYGIFKNIGTKATGTAVVTGTNGITIDAESELQSATGNKYQTTVDATVSSGTANLTIEAKATGTDYNEDVGAVLTFSSPIPGVSATATLTGTGITGGINEDTKEQFRTKILNRKRQSPHGGIEIDYENWSLEYSGSITRAWAIPEYQGIGTIGLAFVMDNEDNIFPNESTRDALRAYIVSHYDSAIGKYVGIPVTANSGFFIIALTPYTIDMTIQVYPNTSAVRTAITTKIDELIQQSGEPGGSIAISQFYEAITAAVGEIKSRIITPTDDVSVSTAQLHYPGTITFQDYV